MFDYVGRDEPPLKVVAGSDVVVVVSSTLLHEAAVIGRPTYAILSRIADLRDIPDMFKGIIRVDGLDKSRLDCVYSPAETKIELPSRRILSFFFADLMRDAINLTMGDR